MSFIDVISSMLSSVLYRYNEPPHGKTNNLHRRKQRRRSASQLRSTAKLISAFVFATRIVQFLYFLNPKFQVSSHLLCFYSLVCVGPVWKPHCWFSHKAAQYYDCDHSVKTLFLTNGSPSPYDLSCWWKSKPQSKQPTNRWY